MSDHWSVSMSLLFFFFNDTATTEIYTLSLHDALPISVQRAAGRLTVSERQARSEIAPLLERLEGRQQRVEDAGIPRSEEHTSELQSRQYLVCRLLLEKKKNKSEVTRKSKTCAESNDMI